MKRALRKLVPVSLRRGLARAALRPRVGRIDFGGLRRLEPVSREWGAERGTPVDRHYIERFLSAHAADVRGRVLEVGTDMYTRAFGRGDVERSDVLHVSEQRPGVTIIGDLTRGDGVPPETFDCLIVTQTLQFIFDVPAALATTYRALRSAGVLLATVPGISQISRYDMDRWGDYWRFTTASARRLCEAAFPGGRVEVGAMGNVLSSMAFLHGIAAEELDPAELAHLDPDYELLITIRASKV